MVLGVNIKHGQHQTFWANILACSKRYHLSLRSVSLKLDIKKPITKFEDLNKQGEVLET